MPAPGTELRDTWSSAHGWRSADGASSSRGLGSWQDWGGGAQRACVGGAAAPPLARWGLRGPSSSVHRSLRFHCCCYSKVKIRFVPPSPVHLPSFLPFSLGFELWAFVHAEQPLDHRATHPLGYLMHLVPHIQTINIFQLSPNLDLNDPSCSFLLSDLLRCRLNLDYCPRKTLLRR